MACVDRVPHVGKERLERGLPALEVALPSSLSRCSDSKLEGWMSAVVIGMDPHKRTATIEVMASDEAVVGGGRYATDAAGYRSMLAEAKQWPERVWAIEGCQGIGRHIASRLLADGEHVVDVPPKLSARIRVFATGQGRKTDATDAHSVALAAARMAGLRPLIADQQLMVLRILADRRRSLGEDHIRMICQLHQLLLELIPGGRQEEPVRGPGQGAARQGPPARCGRPGAPAGSS
jgi:transposase